MVGHAVEVARCVSQPRRDWSLRLLAHLVDEEMQLDEEMHVLRPVFPALSFWLPAGLPMRCSVRTDPAFLSLSPQAATRLTPFAACASGVFLDSTFSTFASQ